VTFDVEQRRQQQQPVEAAEAAEVSPPPASHTRYSTRGPIPPIHAESTAHAPTASERAYGTPEPGVLAAEQRRVIAGVTVVAPAGAHASAIDSCAEFIQQEVGQNAYAQQHLAAARATIVIIPARTKMTDVSQFSKLKGQKTFDGRDWSQVRGSGGTRAPDGSFAIGVAEENLISVKGVVSTYAKNYSIGMHELAHAVESKGMTPDQQARLRQLFAKHQAADAGDAKDTFTDTYAASNVHEYFAQATNAFFGKNEGRDKDGRANHNGRAWLMEHDPNMYAFLVELYETNHDADGDRVS
jgi:hypothetical protein